EPSWRNVDGRWPHGGEARPSVGIREPPAFAQSGAAPLDRVALLLEPLDSVVQRKDLRDLLPDLLGIVEVDLSLVLGSDPFGQIHENLPLGPALADLVALDFRREIDPTF